MSQISPPIRILLAASLALMTAWFVFLKPGPVAPPAPAPAPAGSGVTSAVDKAKEATATANSASAAAAAADGTGGTGGTVAEPNTAGATSTTTGAKPSPAKSAASKDPELGLPPSVAKAVAQKKVLVMLFWNKRAYDDQAVRRELRGIDRHKGKVKVHVASINDVARYAPITRGVNLEQSPTVVVVKGKTADSLVGYVDRDSIDQTVSDVLRSKAG